MKWPGVILAGLLTLVLMLLSGIAANGLIKTIRTGVDPSGHQLKPTMPWQTYARMDDVELAAIYEYMHNLPPVEATLQ